MRVLLCNVFYAPQSIGGATRVVEDNAHDFREMGAVSDLAVFCSLQGARQPGETRTYRTRDAQVMAIATQSGPKVDLLASDPLIRRRFAEFIDYFQPDIIHFHCLQRLTSEVCLEAQERGIPYLITMHDGWWISDRQFLLNDAGEIETYDYRAPGKASALFGEKAMKRQALLQKALNGAARLLTVSRTFADVLAEAGLEDVDVSTNGVSDVPALPKIASDKVTLGYLAGAAHYKGYHLMRATIMKGNFDKIRLVVVDHSLRAHQTIREKWGSTDIERIGLVPQSEVADLYARLNVVLVPSIWPESFGLVAREALLTRSWLVASNRGAAAEDVQEGLNGHVFDPGIRGDLARVLQKINESPETYSKPSAPTPIRSKREQAEELIGIYRGILDQSSPAPRMRAGNDA